MPKLFVAFLFTCIALQGLAQVPELGLPVGHTKAVSSVAFSPNGRYVLTGSRDKLAKLWDLDGHVLRTFKGSSEPVTGVGFSPRGTYVSLQSRDSTQIWNTGGQMLLKCTGSPVFSPDETALLLKLGDTTVLQNLADGNRLVVSTESIQVMHFSPDGRFLLLLHPESLEMCTATGKRIKKIWSVPVTGQNSDAAFSPDQQHILLGSPDGIITWFDLKGKKINSIGESGVPAFMQPFNAIVCIFSWARLGFSDNGKYVYNSATQISGVFESDITNSENWLRPYKQMRSEISTDSATQLIFDRVSFKHILQISPDGAMLLWRDSLNRRITLTRMNGETLFALDGLYGPDPRFEMIEDIAYRPANAVFDPGGRYLLAGFDDGSAEIRGLDGTLIRRFQSGTSARIRKLTQSPDPDQLLLDLDFGNESTEKNSVHNSFVLDLAENHLNNRGSDSTSVEPETVSNGGRIRNFLSADQKFQVKGFENGMLQLENYLNSGIFLTPQSGLVQVLENDRHLIQFYDYATSFSSVSDVSLTPDNKYLLTSPSYDCPHVWDLQCLLDPSLPVETDSFLIRYTGSVLKLKAESIVKCSEGILKDAPARSYFLGYAKDNRSLLIRDHQNLYWVNLKGEIIRIFTGHRLDVTGAVFLQDDRFVFSWSEDHTNRIWDARTGKELAAIVFLQNDNWVLTTPQGLFDATPGAMEMMYYVLGLEIIEIEQLKERYYEPGLLQKILGYNQEPLRSVEQFDKVELYPSVGLSLDTAQNILHIRLTPRNGGIGKVSVFINGKEVVEDVNPVAGFEKNRDTLIRIDLKNYAAYFFFDTLSTVSVRAYNKAGWLKSVPHSVQYHPAFARAKGQGSAPDQQRNYAKPALYAIVIGTANYAGTHLDLNYAGKDAIAMASAFKQAGGSLFGVDSVYVQLLTTDTADAGMHPSKANIKAAFDAVRMKPAKAEDLLVVYFSGHGIAYGEADKSLFYYLTQDCVSDNLSDPALREANTVSSEEMTRWINQVPPQKQVLILDACNSGKMVELMTSIGAKSLDATQVRAFDRMKDRTGMFLLAGSAADKLSYEALDYGHGLLTHALLSGMNGLELGAGRLVDVRRLFEYAINEVPNLSKSIPGVQSVQRPMLASPLLGSFYIGRVEGTLDIPPSETKPVFIRNIFLNETTLTDDLQLTDALDTRFQTLTVKGAQSAIIYADVLHYENGYSVKGLYTVADNKATIRCRIFKGAAAIESFEVKGPADDVRGLTNQIMQKIQAHF